MSNKHWDQHRRRADVTPRPRCISSRCRVWQRRHCGGPSARLQDRAALWSSIEQLEAGQLGGGTRPSLLLGRNRSDMSAVSDFQDHRPDDWALNLDLLAKLIFGGPPSVPVKKSWFRRVNTRKRDRNCRTHLHSRLSIAKLFILSWTI